MDKVLSVPAFVPASAAAFFAAASLAAAALCEDAAAF